MPQKKKTIRNHWVNNKLGCWRYHSLSQIAGGVFIIEIGKNDGRILILATENKYVRIIKHRVRWWQVGGGLQTVKR